MPGGEVHQLQDNYRLSIPFVAADPLVDTDLRSIERVFNALPVDSAMLWQGGSIASVTAPNLTWTDVGLDGVPYANDGFTVDATANTISVQRAGWYEVFWNIRFAAATALKNTRIYITNNSPGSPYPNPMIFNAPASDHEVVGASTLCPLGPSDTLEIQGFQQSGGNLGLKLENLFMRWTRPYRI